MTKVVLLDTGPLGEITHPRVKPEIINWLQFLQGTATILRVPEIADYELRRELVRKGKQTSINRLDQFGQPRFIPLTPETMRKAAELWAWVRAKGKPTASDDSLDGDVILVAQATLQTRSFDEVMIVTKNMRHISLFQTAKISVCDWQFSLENLV
jgi:predicted nucleic acid-binding protein